MRRRRTRHRGGGDPGWHGRFPTAVFVQDMGERASPVELGGRRVGRDVPVLDLLTIVVLTQST